MEPKKILALAGDGIGPEVMAAALRVLDAASAGHLKLTVENGLVGGASYDHAGVPLTDAVAEAARSADAVLLGAVGGPKWQYVAREHRPEAGLLALRQALGVFANLRPATVMPALAASSSLKQELVSGLDIMIVRELTGGVYFGKPRYNKTLDSGKRQAVDTQIYDENEIERIVRVGFEAARARNHRLCSVEKSNVMETGVLWREIATELASDYPDVELSHMYADNCAMQLVRTPKQFDVIVTDNLFGDILSDAAAMLTGSLGMLPSASLAGSDTDGSVGLYEPVHGSAPDIAGQGLANPAAMILSAAMACRYSLGADAVADRMEAAVNTALDKGARTKDIAADGADYLGTEAMADAVIAEL